MPSHWWNSCTTRGKDCIEGGSGIVGAAKRFLQSLTPRGNSQLDPSQLEAGAEPLSRVEEHQPACEQPWTAEAIPTSTSAGPPPAPAATQGQADLSSVQPPLAKLEEQPSAVNAEVDAVSSVASAALAEEASVAAEPMGKDGTVSTPSSPPGPVGEASPTAESEGQQPVNDQESSESSDEEPENLPAPAQEKSAPPVVPPLAMPVAVEATEDIQADALETMREAEEELKRILAEQEALDEERRKKKDLKVANNEFAKAMQRRRQVVDDGGEVFASPRPELPSARRDDPGSPSPRQDPGSPSPRGA